MAATAGNDRHHWRAGTRSKLAFFRPCSYGDVVEVHTSIEEWRGKSFVMTHELRRGEQLLAQGRDIRVFAIRHPDDPSRIKAVPIPENIKRLCL